MKRSLTNMYNQLSAEERFRLVIAAFAREDEREAERLSNCCPRKVYEMNDLDFSNRLKTCEVIVSHVYAELMEALSVLRTIEAYKEAIEGYEEILVSTLEWATEESALSFHQGWDAGCDHAWQVAGKHAPFPWNDKANLNERAEETAKRLRANRSSESSDGSHLATLEKVSEALSILVQTIWEAFSRFCRKQIGLDPETVLRACFPPALDLPEKLKDMAGSAQADSASLEEYEAMLVRTWSELVGP